MRRRRRSSARPRKCTAGCTGRMHGRLQNLVTELIAQLGAVRGLLSASFLSLRLATNTSRTALAIRVTVPESGDMSRIRNSAPFSYIPEVSASCRKIVADVKTTCVLVANQAKMASGKCGTMCNANRFMKVVQGSHDVRTNEVCRIVLPHHGRHERWALGDRQFRGIHRSFVSIMPMSFRRHAIVYLGRLDWRREMRVQQIQTYILRRRRC